MESANIEKIIEKYFEGTTSLQEEAILKNYFVQGNVAPHLQEYQLLFSYFATAQEESYTKSIQLIPKQSQRKNRYWMSIVASIALLTCMFVGKQQYDEYQQQQEVERLFAELSKGLRLLSTNLQKGEQAVATLYTYEKVVQKITE